MEKTIAAFDFDGTLTTVDSFWRLILRCFGVGRIALTGVRLAPVLLAYAAGLASNDKAKERVFAALFGGFPAEEFRIYCQRFSETCIPAIIDPQALSAVFAHHEARHELVIVTSSMPDWVEPWARMNGFSRVIGTLPEIANGVVTGRFASLNCHGAEKLRRFLDAYPERDTYVLYYYGDNSGDRKMLEIADYPFYRRFA